MPKRKPPHRGSRENQSCWSAPRGYYLAAGAAVAAAALASVARGVAAPMTAAMTSLFVALSAAPLLMAAGTLAPGADAAAVG